MQGKSEESGREKSEERTKKDALCGPERARAHDDEVGAETVACRQHRIARVCGNKVALARTPALRGLLQT